MTTSAEIRAACARGELKGQTSGLAPGYVQANLVMLRQADAFEFLLFCMRNPRACPLLEVLDPGQTEPLLCAPGADLRTDLPRYRLFRSGQATRDCEDIRASFEDDMVSFLIGCSFTFENALLSAGLPVRHIAAGRNVPMYVTNRLCRPAGRFSGPLVVSMRPIPAALVDRAVALTTPFRLAHGAPVHVGDPEGLGIKDIHQVDFGDPPDLQPGDLPVFWACGVTPQLALRQARPELAITHAPGHMFITDLCEGVVLAAKGSLYDQD